MLVDAQTLEAHLQDPEWVVFDCRHDLFDTQRGARLYAEGHLPGAFFAPMDTALSGAKTGKTGRHPLPKPDDFAAFLSRNGVNAATQIVTYDDVGGQYAARMWWLARWIGLTRVAILDGGLPKWIASGHAVTTLLPPARPAGSLVARPDENQVSDVSAVRAGITEGSALVLDARAAERFRGEAEPIDSVAGHIPTAQNRFFKWNLNPDLTFRSPPELRREFEALLGHRPAGQMIHQCGSGVTACVNLFAMELAGLPGSKLYPGSWSEWIADPIRPVAKG